MYCNGIDEGVEVSREACVFGGMNEDSRFCGHADCSTRFSEGRCNMDIIRE